MRSLGTASNNRQFYSHGVCHENNRGGFPFISEFIDYCF
jgi:hypothetical protein